MSLIYQCDYCRKTSRDTNVTFVDGPIIAKVRNPYGKDFRVICKIGIESEEDYNMYLNLVKVVKESCKPNTTRDEIFQKIKAAQTPENDYPCICNNCRKEIAYTVMKSYNPNEVKDTTNPALSKRKILTDDEWEQVEQFINDLPELRDRSTMPREIRDLVDDIEDDDFEEDDFEEDNS